jgi:SSS family solute:Na+ symporter
LASMLNSASTIFTMDLFKRHWKKDASQKALIWTGRVSTAVFVVIGMFIAPKLGDPRFMGIFTYIQEFQGYISPGILAVFVFGMIFKRAPAAAGVTGLLLTVPVYGFLQWQFGEIAFLNRMAITFVVILVTMFVITKLKPLPEPKVMPVRKEFDMRPAPSVVWLGVLVIVITLALYVIFW